MNETETVASYAALLLAFVSAEARLADLQKRVETFDISDAERTKAEEQVNAVSQDVKAVLRA